MHTNSNHVELGTQPKLDPKLLTALQLGKPENTRVQALVTLRSLPSQRVLAPAQTNEIVDGVLARARGTGLVTKKNAPKVVIFEQLQSFAIDAPAALLEKLLKDQAIDSASLNKSSAS